VPAQAETPVLALRRQSARQVLSVEHHHSANTARRELRGGGEARRPGPDHRDLHIHDTGAAHAPLRSKDMICPAVISDSGPRFVTAPTAAWPSRERISRSAAVQKYAWHRPAVAHVRFFTPSRVRAGTGLCSASTISPSLTVSQRQTMRP
jgi:hypothetical protein